MKAEEYTPTPLTALELTRLALELVSTRTQLDETCGIKTRNSVKIGFETDTMWSFAVKRAHELWEVSNRHLQNQAEITAKLKVFADGIFTINKATWEAMREEFPGYDNQDNLARTGIRAQIISALSAKHFQTELVRRKLFPDGTHSRATRIVLMDSLVNKARMDEVKWNGGIISDVAARMLKEVIQQPTINGALCRWLYEVRQLQIAANKVRGKEITRNRVASKPDADSRIQHKKPFKQTPQ